MKYCHPCYGFFISKFQKFTSWNFSGLVIPLELFLQKGRDYVSIIIILVSSITVLVSDNIIFLGYFMSLSYGINNKTPPSTSYDPRPQLSSFYQVCLLFCNIYFISLILLIFYDILFTVLSS